MTPAAAIAPGGLLGDYFDGDSWDRWRAVLKAAFGEPLTPVEGALFREVAERDPPPEPVQELWAVAGRRAGKDSIASALATVAALGDYSAQLRPGERATIMCLASTRDQAAIVFRYILGYFQRVPLLAALIERETDDTIELTNGAEIVVATNSFRVVRGRSVVVAILDEVAFYRSDESASPDSELYNALLPAMATFPNALLIGISSPYRRAGLLFEKWRQSYGRNDPECLVVRGASRVFNETLRQSIVDARLAADPEAGASEYLAEWRSDLSDFLDRELVESMVDHDTHARPPHPSREYWCFVDSAGGRGSSFTAAIAHADDDVAVIDALYERRAPFNPTDVVRDVAELMRSYGVARAIGDRYSAGWVTEAFAKEGIGYENSTRDRSAIYQDALPLFTSGRIRLLDNARLVHQFSSLERRISRFGKDGVAAPVGGSDDLANSCAGVAVLVASDPRTALISQSDLGIGAPPTEIARPHAFFATVWVGLDGIAAHAIFAYSRLPTVPLLIVDFDTGPWTAAILPSIASRLDLLCEQARENGGRLREDGITAIMLVPAQLEDSARAAMYEAFLPRLSRLDIQRRQLVVNPIDAEYLRDAARLALTAASLTTAGRVKLGAAAIEQSRGKPLLSALSVRPGEAVTSGALRMALLLGIAQLGPTPSQQSGARIQFH